MTQDTPTSHVFQAKVSQQSPMVVGGKGIHITIEDPVTKERKVCIDAISGAAVCSLGHGDPDIVAAMKAAAEVSTYSYGMYISNWAAEALGKFIVDNSPEGAFASALFTGSGSESNENALKIMRQYFLEKNEPERLKFISRKQSYHGFTIGALSIGSNARKEMFAPITLPEAITPKVSQVFPYRDMKAGQTEAEYVTQLLEELEDTIVKNDPKTVAGVIFETVGGSTYGTQPPLPGYLDGAKAICEKYGILFMLDEVMCGTGRCGSLHAWTQFMDNSSGPDLQSIGKTLGSGFVTIAGVLVSPKVKKAFEEGSGAIMGAQTYHSHDFNCRVALAVQEKVKRENLVENIKEQGNYMGQSLKEKLKDCSIVGEVRGAGGFWSVEFVKDKATKECFPASVDVSHFIGDKCKEKGLLLMAMNGTSDGKVGDHITLGPAFTVTKDDIETIVSVVVESVLEAEKELA